MCIIVKGLMLGVVCNPVRYSKQRDNIYKIIYFGDSVRRFVRLGLSMRFTELEFWVK